jgi:Polyketide cyclase / dehydrase and lipid transport
MKTQYSFVTKWELEASLQEVWDAIYNSLEWPQWWKGVLSVEEIEKEDENGINGVKSYTWKSVLPYNLTFTMRLTEKQPMKMLKGIAFGELEGLGKWTFNEQNGIIQIQYNWDVYTEKAWMNYLSFLLKPAFRYNHNVVMHWGAIGLAKKLNAKLLRG